VHPAQNTTSRDITGKGSSLSNHVWPQHPQDCCRLHRRPWRLPLFRCIRSGSSCLGGGARLLRNFLVPSRPKCWRRRSPPQRLWSRDVPAQPGSELFICPECCSTEGDRSRGRIPLQLEGARRRGRAGLYARHKLGGHCCAAGATSSASCSAGRGHRIERSPGPGWLPQGRGSQERAGDGYLHASRREQARIQSLGLGQIQWYRALLLWP